MHLPRIILLVCLLGACQGPKEKVAFMHQAHRGKYFLKDVDISGITFYLSDKVVARDREIRDTDQIIIALKGSAGRVVEVGKDWIRVRFSDGGGGTFVTDTGKKDDFYWLGTADEESEGYVKVRSLKEQSVVHEGRTYDLLEGSFAHLRMAPEDWELVLANHSRVIGDPEELPAP